MTPDSALPTAWHGLIDDAAIFPPGDADLGSAVRTYDSRSGTARHLVASFVVTDEKLPQVREHADPAGVPVSVVVTGGAGAVVGACRLARRGGHPLHALEVTLRDLDALAGNARRVVAAIDEARGEGLLSDDTEVYVELPQAETTNGWLAAADEVAAAELRLKFRTGGVEAHLFPTAYQLASWIDAALDRETPFKCTAGLHHTVAHRDQATGFVHHGFLNVLSATQHAFDGAASTDVERLLAATDATVLIGGLDVPRARRWFTSFGSCSVDEPLDDLVSLGLVEVQQ